MINLITSIYNNQSTLPDTILSLELQNQGFNWIIQDGGSKDNSLSLVEASTLKKEVLSEKDSGLYDALNRAIKRVNSGVIGFCHADDCLANEGVIEKVKKAFEENPNIDAVYGDLEYKDESMTKTVRKWRSGESQSMSTGWMPPHPALFVKKEVFDEIGLFRTDIGSAADYEWMLRAIHFNKIKLHYIPDVLVHMRSGGMSNKNIAARKEGMNGDLMAWKLNSGSKNYLAVILKKLRKLPQYLN